MEPKVIHEEKNFIAIYKPAGLLVHPAKRDSFDEERTLVHWLLKKYPELKAVGDDPEWRPGIVHRLDKETSGILLIPRNQAYFTYLKKEFQNHRIKKTYIALVRGKLLSREGRIEKPIAFAKEGLKRTTFGGRGEKMAVTSYKVRRYVGSYTLLEAYPETGRTHQIRVHLKSIGHPVAGDSLYGPKRPDIQIGRLMLHALSLEFAPFPEKRLKIEAEPPQEFGEIIHKLEKEDEGRVL